jgi:cytochrome b involved in lipid metabolism
MKYTLIAFLLLTTLLVTWCSSKTAAPNTDTAIIEENNAVVENTVDDNDDMNDNDGEEAEEYIAPVLPEADREAPEAPTPGVWTDLPVYSAADVERHSLESDCWTSIRGAVYDLTARVDAHPGGDKNILRLCWIDGTEAFERQHGGKTKPEETLAWFQIGLLNK